MLVKQSGTNLHALCHLLYCVQLNNNIARVVLHANDNQGNKYILLHTAHDDIIIIIIVIML